MTEATSITQLEAEQATEQHRLKMADSLPAGVMETASGFEPFKKLESNYHDYTRQLEAIKNNPELSDAERMNIAAEARRKATAAHEENAQALATAVQEESSKLERRLFAGPHDSTGVFPEERANNIAAQESYRNALASLSGQDAETLSDTLERANLTGDELLAQAVLTTAHREGYQEVVSRYADGRPEQAGRYSTLTTLPGDNALSVLASAYRPPEVANVEQLQTSYHVREQAENERRAQEQAALRDRAFGPLNSGPPRYGRTPPR